MELALYLGCLIPTEQYSYEMSIREVLPELGVDLVDIGDFSCCGAPLRNINRSLTMYLSARNLALAEREGLDILAPCPYCHQALTRAQQVLKDNDELKENVNGNLEKEGLEYRGETELFHLLDLLHDEIGVDEIEEHVEEPLDDLKIATHYGCHLVRPNDIPRPDDSENPQKLEDLLRAIGADTEDYVEKLNCCGAQIMVNHSESGLTKTGQKLQAVQEHGFEGLTTTCPWGHRMLDTKQDSAAKTLGEDLDVPVVYFIQLIGVTMGIDEKKLGLELNLSPIDKIGLIEEVK